MRKYKYIVIPAIIMLMLASMLFYVFSRPSDVISQTSGSGSGSNVKPGFMNNGLNTANPCDPQKMGSTSPFESQVTVDCPQLGAGVAGASANASTSLLAPIDYEGNRQQRAFKMIEGVKQGNVSSAADTVFTSKYCEKLGKVEKENNHCIEIVASRSAAITSLQQAANKGDAEASFALARASHLDSPDEGKRKAIALLEAIPSKTADMNAYLQYLKR